MPYITKEDRQLHERVLQEYSALLWLGGIDQINPRSRHSVLEHCAHVIDVFCRAVYDVEDSSYWEYNELGGAISRCSKEYHRRSNVIIPDTRSDSSYVAIAGMLMYPKRRIDAPYMHVINDVERLGGIIRFTDSRVRPGHVNYFIYSILKATFNEETWLWSKREETAIAMLEALDDFYYNTYVAPYEDRKILENGDI